ncbi:MAG TPA: M13 family metallopeptidase [Vicinamibacterales bacterium]|nr:M13 family metallopeptidase [Vicinamibacterales bacterium]
MKASVSASALLILALGMSAGCSSTPTALAPAATLSGIDLAGMDKSVAPGDDFNAYANGAWIKATPIPPDKSSYGAATILVDHTRQRTIALIQDPANAGPSATPDTRKMADFYASYMDEGGIESKGIEPVKPELDAIAAIGDKRALARAIGRTLRTDVDPLNATNFQTEHLFGVWIAQGLNDPDHNTPYLLQGGLGLPDRDYYVSTSPKIAELRTAYTRHVAAVLALAGFPDSPARARRIVDLETKIAAVHATRVQSADVRLPQAWRREALAANAPGLDWPALLEAAGLKDAQTFIAWHPAAVTGLAALVAKAPLDAWKDWLAFHTVNQATGFLSKAFVDEGFAFYGKLLNGTPEQRPRWERGVDSTNAALGDVVGRLYAARYFSPDAKAKARAMVDDLTKAFDRRIDALQWMTPETKAKAKAKVKTLYVGVGYPDKWIDYTPLQIVKGDALGNLQRAELFEYRRQLAKLQQPVDRQEWWMTPQTVNAVNLPLQNALNFPAAILQPPYFDPARAAAANFGAMGATIGHEISHSFDDQGSQFDAQGRLANWWTPQDLDHFKAAGEALAAQYDTYRPFPDLAINGHQVLSENIADLAGLAAAYDAYHLSLNGRPAADQDFFVSFAQSWRNKFREEALRLQVTTDGHSPDAYRVATVRNLDPWYAAFSVTPGQRAYLAPDMRVRVW